MFTAIYVITFLLVCLPVAWALAQRKPAQRAWVWLATAALGLVMWPLADILFRVVLARLPAAAGDHSPGAGLLTGMLVAVVVCAPIGLIGNRLLRRAP